MNNFNKYFDHTLLKANATEADIATLCREACENDFASVCVNGCFVKFASEKIKILNRSFGSTVRVCAVTGFPLGASSTAVKVFEADRAITDGASEIDVVMNIGDAISSNWDSIENELKTIAEICHDGGAILKVILETCLLTDEEIREACARAAIAGADFVKTSTGFATPAEGIPSGATANHVSIMKESSGSKVRVKASGGIRTLESALKLIDAGADRLGCSASVSIMNEYRAKGL